MRQSSHPPLSGNDGNDDDDDDDDNGDNDDDTTGLDAKGEPMAPGQ